MVLVAVPDGNGGMRHVLRQGTVTQSKKKPHKQPDPLKARNKNGEELKSYLERIERIEAEVATLAEDKAEIFSELKNRGYSEAVVRGMLAERKKDQSEVREYNETMAMYKHAVGWGE